MQRLEDMTEPELVQVCGLAGKAIETMFQILGIERPRFALLLFNDPKVTQFVSRGGPGPETP